MRIIFYIDGFNLYYGLRQRGALITPQHPTQKPYPSHTNKYKWLNIQKLAESLRPHDEVVKVKYFTAKIRNDSASLNRQQTYLDALTSLNKVEVYYGRYLESHPVMFTHPLTEPPQKVKVIKREEKGSDVNLCTHLIIDAMSGNFDAAAIISNDTDFCFPISYVKDTLKKPVYIFNPKSVPAKDLEKCSTSIYPINNNMLSSCQFPKNVNTPKREVTCPLEWLSK